MNINMINLPTDNTETARDFHIYVMATMSSGKSTLINAIVGHELLPSANEATTATITRIIDNDGMDTFSATKIGNNGEKITTSDNANLALMKLWNNESNTKQIEIEGNIESIKEHSHTRLVLTDTPGPNNSQDASHFNTTINFIKNTNENFVVLYVLNATQLGTYDDKYLLNLIAEIIKEKGEQIKNRFIFAVNKIDCFDPEEENITAILHNVRRYLESNGIESPLVYPISAHLALLLRKPQSQHTRAERIKLHTLTSLFEEESEMNMMRYMPPLSAEVMQMLTTQAPSDLLLKSGVPVIEALINCSVKEANTLTTASMTMKKIEIKHNPFTVETTILINGKPPAENSKLSSYKETRLQVWIEDFFKELDDFFNGDNNFHITFTGVESDFLDIKEAAEKAKKADGMTIQLEWVKTAPAEDRLVKLEELLNTAYENSYFAHFIRDNHDVSHAIKEALNRDFDVYVVATMSSGKSTLINAMLGKNLLPAANEATTATITRVFDNDNLGGNFTAKRYNSKNIEIDTSKEISEEILRTWNKEPDTKRIDIEGNIKSIKKRPNARLVITDTPGPNNSQDPEHQRTTMGFIQDSQRNPLILYILNATQLGTEDDRNLLNLVAEKMSAQGKQNKDRFVFIVNKMDAFDPEKEYIPDILERVRNYLKNQGIAHPQIYPISANLARQLRLPEETLTRADRGDKKKNIDLFDEEPSMDLVQYMPISERTKRAMLERNADTPILLKSGLPAVEQVIDEYIDKYNLPFRLKRAYDAIKLAINNSLNETDLIKKLDQDEKVLASINADIQEIEKRRQKGFDTTAYKSKIAREGKRLPKHIENTLNTLRHNSGHAFRKIKAVIIKEASPYEAEQQIKQAEESLQFIYNQFINECENVFLSSQSHIRKELGEEYQKYVSDIFESCADLDLPILEGIKESVSAISFDFGLNDADIQEKEVVVGTKTVSASTWYNPFSWGSTKEVQILKTEKFVDLEAVWNKQAVAHQAKFNGLFKDAEKRIEQGKNTLVDQYIAFLDNEFNQKFNELLQSLEEKTSNKEAREQAIKDAKALSSWIAEFKQELEKTLAI